MAGWVPTSGQPIQYQQSNGDFAAGYYIKFYAAGTTNPINMALDQTGATQIAKCQINTEGYAVNESGGVFIPYINQDYKIALYPNAADADANTIANAVFPPVDDIQVIQQQSNVNTKAELTALNASITTVANSLGYNSRGDGGGFSAYFIAGDSTPETPYIFPDDLNTGRWFIEVRGNEYHTLQGGCYGNGATDDFTTILEITKAAKEFRDGGDVSSVAVKFDTPSSYYRITSPLPIATGISFIGPYRNGTKVISEGCPCVYSATYSAGVFTDNLDGNFTQRATNVSIDNMFFEDDGNISGNSPDSSTPWSHLVHLNATWDMTVINIRNTVRTNKIGGTFINNAFRCYVEAPYIIKTGARGGHGLEIGSVSNSCTINTPKISGDFKYGLRVGNPDGCSIITPNVENCIAGIYLNGDAPKIYGGYLEGNDVYEIAIGWDSATTCFNWRLNTPWLQGTENNLDLTSGDYTWQNTTGFEYSLQLDGGLPDIPKLSGVLENGVELGRGTAGSLISGQWDWSGDTVHVRLNDGDDPDNKAAGFIESTAHGIALGRCQGGTLTEPHWQGTYDKQYISESASNGNVGNMIEIALSDATNPDLSGKGLDDGKNVVKVYSKDFSDHRSYKEWSTENNALLEQELNQRGSGFCMFYIDIRNNSGTLQARIVDGKGSSNEYNDCFISSSTSYASLGSDLASGQGFGSSGCGRLGGANSYVVLNTVGQRSSEQAYMAGSIYTNNGTVAVCAEVSQESRNIGGTTQFRPEINLRVASTGAAWFLNTTNLPSGTFIKIPLMGFIR